MQIVKNIIIILTLAITFSARCQNENLKPSQSNGLILPGAYSTNEYLPLLNGKKAGIVANNTSLINHTHLVDTLIALKVDIIKIFGPEHGFRGDAPDGKLINTSKDAKTGLEVISLYGNHKKPTKADLQNLDILVFDIQDVGTRFYTYISTLVYVMEACAENHVPLIVLDRPNPNGYYVDGPVLEPEYKSFVGINPVPIVYGMTIGEYAKMVNGEKWLSGGIQCNLNIIKCNNYKHNSRYRLPIRPSPNLQDMKAIYLYPSLCLFEGTVVSVGRGTEMPFRIYGHPKLTTGSYSFKPKPIKGVSEDPPLNGQICYGKDISKVADAIKNKGKLELGPIIETYKTLNSQTEFFNNYFDKLAGNSSLREQIKEGIPESEIRKSWQPGIDVFKKIRKKYLLYPDFD